MKYQVTIDNIDFLRGLIAKRENIDSQLEEAGEELAINRMALLDEERGQIDHELADALVAILTDCVFSCRHGDINDDEGGDEGDPAWNDAVDVAAMLYADSIDSDAVIWEIYKWLLREDVGTVGSEAKVTVPLSELADAWKRAAPLAAQHVAFFRKQE